MNNETSVAFCHHVVGGPGGTAAVTPAPPSAAANTSSLFSTMVRAVMNATTTQGQEINIMY